MPLVNYKTGDKVTFNLKVLKNRNGNRCSNITWLSDSFLRKATEMEDVVGVVGRKFHDYEFNVEFPNGWIFHCKDDYVNKVA